MISAGESRCNTHAVCLADRGSVSSAAAQHGSARSRDGRFGAAVDFGRRHGGATSESGSTSVRAPSCRGRWWISGSSGRSGGSKRPLTRRPVRAPLVARGGCTGRLARAAEAVIIGRAVCRRTCQTLAICDCADSCRFTFRCWRTSTCSASCGRFDNQAVRSRLFESGNYAGSRLGACAAAVPVAHNATRGLCSELPDNGEAGARAESRGGRASQIQAQAARHGPARDATCSS